MASVRDKPSHIDDGDTRYQPRESLEGEYSYETNLSKIDMFGLGATLYALARGEELPQGGGRKRRKGKGSGEIGRWER